MGSKGVVQEIISVSGLIEYEEVLKDIIHEIHNRVFNLSCRYDSNQSVIEWESSLIRISVKRGNDHGINILWDLLHEFGHLLDLKPNNNDPGIKREISAWNNAEKFIKSYPELKLKYDSFLMRRNECLKTYQE